MEARNGAAHIIGGDNIITSLDHCSGDVKWILKRGFKMLFGIFFLLWLIWHQKKPPPDTEQVPHDISAPRTPSLRPAEPSKLQRPMNTLPLPLPRNASYCGVGVQSHPVVPNLTPRILGCHGQFFKICASYIEIHLIVPDFGGFRTGCKSRYL